MSSSSMTMPGYGYEGDASLAHAHTDEDVTPSEIAVGVIIGRSSEYFDFFVFGLPTGMIPSTPRTRFHSGKLFSSRAIHPTGGGPGHLWLSPISQSPSGASLAGVDWSTKGLAYRPTFGGSH